MPLDFANHPSKDLADQSKFQFTSHNVVANPTALTFLAQ
jgi:hypothetical protein